MEAILTYKSQFVMPDINESNSIIGLLAQIKSMNSIYGRPSNCNFAKGFTVNRYPGVTDLYQLI